MKVTHLNTYSEGGAAEAALRLHNALLKENITSKFLALYKGSCQQKEVYDFRDKLSFLNYWLTKIKNKLNTTKTLSISTKAGEWFSDIHSVWKADEHPMIKASDIVHLHWISNYVDLPSFLKNDKKIIWTLHDHFLFSGGFHYPPPVKNVVSDEKIESQKQIIKALLAQHPIDIVCPSENLKQLAEASGVLSKCRFRVIKNPIDETVFKPLSKEDCRKKLNIGLNDKVIFFLSDHIDYERKGFPLLAKALALLDNEMALIVAGRGELPAKIGKAKIQHFGLVKDKSLLNELYNACDIMVNPSLNDISSNTVIEAMACGKPSVAFNSGGIPELISELNGLIAPEKTGESLAETINKAFKINYDASAITKKALTEHGSDVIAGKYIEVYKKINS